MKTLIFSDTHLSDEFDEAHFNALVSAISNADHVIINGDFWDVYLTTFEDFLNSPWQQLFALLKERNAVYLFGNHDKPEFSDERTSLFSEKQEFKHEIAIGEKQALVLHGHLVVPEVDDLFPRFANKFGKHYGKLHKIKERESTLGKISRKFDSKYRKRLHRKLVAFANDLTTHDYLISGHSHFRSVDDSKRYINPGDFRNGWARYVIIEGNNFEVVEEQYETNPTRR